MDYEPTLESLRRHRVPQWYEDAKFGIFIHWTPSTIPAFAPANIDIQSLVRKQGPVALFSHSPYSEWYLNSLRIPGSPVARHHAETWGVDYPYAGFVDSFRESIEEWDPRSWADLFAAAQARYVVLVTKHHDGFLLWPSATRHPARPNWYSARDVVAELTSAVRRRGLRMGFYYSGAIDWSFTREPVTRLAQFLTSGPGSRQYAKYVDSHYRELISIHSPEVLWNDIAYPGRANLKTLIADYYNHVPEGVINDRWFEVTTALRLLAKTPGMSGVMERQIARAFEGGQTPGNNMHFDYSTPEYRTLNEISPHKWECCRGIGHSFGYNREEPDENFLSGAELVRLLVDIVAKNGNLLLNVGPMADGTIPDVQRKSLAGLGAWLGRYGDAIFATRPWRRFDLDNDAGIEIRVTSTARHLYLTLLSRPGRGRITFRGLPPATQEDPIWLASGETLPSIREGEALTIDLPDVRGEWIAEVIRLPIAEGAPHV